MVGVVGGLSVLDDPLRGTPRVQLVEIGDHLLEGAPSRAHAADRCDLGAEGQDRLDAQRRAQQRLCGTDPPAAAQILEGVQAKPDVESLPRVADGGDHRVERVPALGRASGGEDE